MMRTLSLLIAVFFISQAFAQHISLPGQHPDHDPRAGIVYTSADEMPRFPGGDSAMTIFIRDNVRYPEYARENNIEGTVTVGYIVNKDGTVSDVALVKESNVHLDFEAKRIVKFFPRFTPGRINGIPVRVRLAVNIYFRLSPDGYGKPESQ